jgi:hypothetical protein
MQNGGNPTRVKLMVDLTRYNEKCKIGELGWTIPNVKFSIWGSTDRFVAVNFDNGAKLDVLWESLEKPG